MMKITFEELKNKYMDIYENHRDQVRYRALWNAKPGQIEVTAAGQIPSNKFIAELVQC